MMNQARGDRFEPLSLRSPRAVQLTLLAWIGMLGVDFFLHAGLLASLYLEPTPFLLPPLEAFVRIPIGYLSFLIAAAFLVWVTDLTGARGWRAGLRTGAIVGGVMWLSLALGLYSISTARPELLVGWAVGQTVEVAWAGALIGAGRVSDSLRRPFQIAILVSFGLLMLTIVGQSIGLVPTGA